MQTVKKSIKKLTIKSLKTPLNRAFLLFGAFLIAFTAVQSALTIILSEKAAAIEASDPITAMQEYGRTPAPLGSEPTEAPEPLDEVSQEVRDQAEKSIAEGRGKDLPKNTESEVAYENISKRTKNSKTFVLKNNQEKVEYYSHDIAYEEDGVLKKIEPKVEEDQEYINKVEAQRSWWQNTPWNSAKGYKGQGGSLDVNFETFRSSDGVKIAKGDTQISTRPLDANDNVEPFKEDDGTVVYKNVWQDVDLIYEYQGNSIKEWIVLNQKPAQTEFKFEISGDVQLREGKNGTIEIVKDSEVLFRIPALSVLVKEKGFVGDSNAKFEINGNVLSIKLDQNWLNQQTEDNYPIAIDPSTADNYISDNFNNYTNFKSDGYECTSSNCLQNVGWLEDSGHKAWQSMMRIPFDQAVGKDLLQAQLQLTKYRQSGVWSGTDAAQRYWVTWAPCFGFGCVNSGAPWVPIEIGADYGGADITELIQWMLDNNQTGGWLMVHGDDSQYKMLNPGGSIIRLTYNSGASKPVHASPSNEAVVTTDMPKLSTNAVTDPDGDTINYIFQLFDNNALVAASEASTRRSWWVPNGVLEDGGTYKWKIGASDGNSTSWSSAREFTVDLRTGKEDDTQTYDEMGPIATNLANGNAYTSVGSHSISALGGDIGLNFEYNSASMSQQGLVAKYYNSHSASNHVLERIEPNVDTHWGTASPLKGTVNQDNFKASWEGYFIAPQTGTYRFGGNADDDIHFYLDNDKDGAYGSQKFHKQVGDTNRWADQTVQLQAGESYKTKTWFYENGGSAAAQLWVRLPDGSEKIIPQHWFRTGPEPVQDNQGLKATFYQDKDETRSFEGKSPILVRNYKNVDLNWGTGSALAYDPYKWMDNDFLVKFDGYITIPTTGDYKFGVASDDGERLYINGEKVTDKWNDNLVFETWSTTKSFVAGDVVPVKLEYYENGGGASVALKWDGPAGKGTIQSQYLSSEYRSLPLGWNLSVDADGDLPYEKLKALSGGNVALMSGDGTKHVFKLKNGKYTPPKNQGGVLTKAKDGKYSFQDVDGRVYEFDADGKLLKVTTPTDDKKPAALKYEYQEVNGVPRLKKIVDDVDANRYGELFYGGDAECQAPSGFDEAPGGFICAFKTYDNQISHFYYQNDKLARVELPGSSITDLASDAKGRITSVRGSLANDAIATSTRQDNDSLLSQITYDEVGRVSAVKAPAANEGGTRQEHTLNYGYRSTTRHVVGTTEPKGYSQKLVYDHMGRTTEVCDNTGQCSTNQWHSTKDILFSATDAKGLFSSTKYDDEDQPVDSYGPAPKEYFDNWEWHLKAGQELKINESILSPDGRFRLTMQSDGNLVVRGVLTGQAKWASGTNGSGANRVVMQRDGNLVIRKDNTAKWASNSVSSSEVKHLSLKNDGKLEIYDIDGQSIWNNGFSQPATKIEYADRLNRPKSAHANQVPHSETKYDEGIVGPEVTYFNYYNRSLTGAPKLRTTGYRQSDPGMLYNVWGSAPPITKDAGMSGWGLRATGKLRVPSDGKYNFAIWHDDGVKLWVGDTLVIDKWDHGAIQKHSGSVNLQSGQVYDFKLEYFDVNQQDSQLDVKMSTANGNDSTLSHVFGEKLKPGYGLVTSTTAYDSELGNKTTTTNYGNRPEYGLAESVTVDPTEQNLTSKATFETPGDGFLRKTSSSLPGAEDTNPTFSYTFYNANEVKDNPCTVEVEAFRQAGRTKGKTEVDPDGAGTKTSRTTETIYDNAGRAVASRMNDDPWTCTEYDVRGRATEVSIPNINGRTGRTITTIYAYQGSPFKTQSTDSLTGSTITEVDLAGNKIYGSDQFGEEFTATYNELGKLISQTSPVGTVEYTYDEYHRSTEYKLNGTIYATLTYDEYSRVKDITYNQANNGTGTLKLQQTKFDQYHKSIGTTYQFADGQTLEEDVTKTVNGTVTGYTNTFAGKTAGASYQYDSIGRLTEATVDTTKFAYGFGSPDATLCNQAESNSSAHKNQNRTSYTKTDLTNNQVVEDYKYCYNHFDQLIATTDNQIGNPTYDDHGNTTGLAGDGNPILLEYNASDQNITIQQGQNKVEYTKTSSGKILRKKEYQNNILTNSYRYLASGSVMQTCDLADDTNCTTQDTYISLPGNVTLTISPQNPDPNNQQTYSLKNFHGDTVLTTNKQGTPTSQVYLYEPFGQKVNSTTFTTNSNPNNSSNQPMGWATDPTRKQETLFTTPILQMGARVYLPTLGRFLQVDPVDQGTANFYVYANDPVNQSDYSGEFLNCGNSQSLSSFFRCITGGDRGSAQTGAKVKERAKYEYKEFKENIVHKPVKKIEETVNTASDWWSARSTEVSVGVATITPIGPVGFNGGLIFNPDGSKHWSFSLGRAIPGVDVSIMKSLKEGNTKSGCRPTASASMGIAVATDFEDKVSDVGLSFPFRPGYFAGYECVW